MSAADLLGESAYRQELLNHTNQWCSYDQLARLCVMRGRDANRLRYTPREVNVGHMVLREDWRLQRETQAMGAIAQQDGKSLTAGSKGLPCGPSGQLVSCARDECAELASLQDEELAVVHRLTSSSLRSNRYRPQADAVGAGAALWRPAADHKADAAKRAGEKVAAAVRAAASADGGAPAEDLAAALQDAAQLLLVCEAALRRLPAEKIAAADPLLFACERARQSRAEWIEAVDAALGDAEPPPMLLRVRKSVVTIDKVTAFRKAHHRKRLQPDPPATPVPSAPTTPMPAALSQSQSPVLPPPPAPPTPSVPLRAATPVQEDGKRRVARKRQPVASTPLRRKMAARVLQRWWQRMVYWRKATDCWRRIAQRSAQLWWRGVCATAAAGRSASDRHPSAATQIQRVWRGCLWGRKAVGRRVAAARTCQRLARGAAARQGAVRAARRAAAARSVQLWRSRLRERQMEDWETAAERRQWVEWVVNVRVELCRTEIALKEEEGRFRREWKAWEERLTKHVLNDLPLDEEYMEQKAPDGSPVYVHIRSRRSQTEHPNLRLVEIHRKRQHVKVARSREQQRDRMKQSVARLSAVLADRIPALEDALARARVSHLSSSLRYRST